MSRELSLWAAQGPDGLIVRSSIGTFRSVAQRFALRKKNYEVVRLGSVVLPYVNENEPQPVKEPEPEPVKAQATFAPTQSEETNQTVETKKRGPGRPRKEQKRGPGRPPKKRGPGRPRKNA